MTNDGERIAVLEAKHEAIEHRFSEFAQESKADRKKLHETLDSLAEVLTTWQSRQVGFIAGASFVLTALAVGVASGWRELLAFFSKH